MTEISQSTGRVDPRVRLSRVGSGQDFSKLRRVRKVRVKNLEIYFFAKFIK